MIVSRSVFQNVYRDYRLPIVSGFLIGTSYIPFPPWALFFCLVPLFVFWQRLNQPAVGSDPANKNKTWKKAFIGGWITQFILNLIGFHWIAYTVVEFGHFPWVVGVLVLLLFAALAHLHYPLAGFLARVLKDKFRLNDGTDLLLLVCLFGLCDHFMPMIFPWHLGYPWLWAKLPGAQFADVIGFDGLYYFTLLINALFAWAILAKRQRAIALAATAFALIIALNLLGLGRATPWTRTDAEADILTVQGNIGNFEKLEAELHREFGRAVVNKFIDVSARGLKENPQTQLMLWPETAYPDILEPQFAWTPLHRMVTNFVRLSRTPLLSGGYSRDTVGPAVYNGLFYLNDQGAEPQPTYRKSILLVFGETFPFSEYLPYVEKLFPNQGSFGRGRGPSLLNIEIPQKQGPEQKIRVGPQICYEGLYPWHSAALANQGAQIFVNVTNDSWFGHVFEPNQHLYMTLARAIEFRRPLIRATNTGFTTGILADGEVLQKSPMDQEWAGLYRIRYLVNPDHTIYEKFGYLWSPCLALLNVLLVVFGRRSTRGSAES